jgi:hypothetical protein
MDCCSTLGAVLAGCKGEQPVSRLRLGTSRLWCWRADSSVRELSASSSCSLSGRVVRLFGDGSSAASAASHSSVVRVMESFTLQLGISEMGRISARTPQTRVEAPIFTMEEPWAWVREEVLREMGRACVGIRPDGRRGGVWERCAESRAEGEMRGIAVVGRFDEGFAGKEPMTRRAEL